MSGYTAQYPRPDHFIVHLSDTHLLGGDTTLYGVLNSEQKLRELFAELEASGARPEALVFTGDLADHGEAGAYRALRAIVEPAAARLGAQVVWVMGNHDSRGEFRSELLDQPASTEPVDRVFDINGLRIIALDSTVPGKHYGHIADHQLAWLSRVLAEPAPHGTILALHHPPIPSVLDLAASVELRGQAELAAIVRGTDVRSIIAGHLHYSTSATFAGIPVSVASATCYTQDLTVPVGGTRGRDGAQAYNLVHVYGETVLHSVVPVGTTQALSFVSAEETAVILAQQNVTIRPADNPHVAVTTPVFDAPQTRPWPAATQPATSPDAAASPDPATPPDAAALTSQGAGIG